jgi:hypothetical protein
VLYRDGHLVEFAVFSPTELPQAKVGRARVLLDHGGVTEMIEALEARSRRGAAVDLRYELGMMATNLLVGMGRHHRGEHLSAHQFVAGHALGHLLRALALRPSTDADLLDGLDPRRRFELVHPGIGSELDSLLGRSLPELAGGMLDIAHREFEDDLADDLFDAMAAARRTINSD